MFQQTDAAANSVSAATSWSTSSRRVGSAGPKSSTYKATKTRSERNQKPNSLEKHRSKRTSPLCDDDTQSKQKKRHRSVRTSAAKGNGNVLSLEAKSVGEDGALDVDASEEIEMANGSGSSSSLVPLLALMGEQRFAAVADEREQVVYISGQICSSTSVPSTPVQFENSCYRLRLGMIFSWFKSLNMFNIYIYGNSLVEISSPTCV